MCHFGNPIHPEVEWSSSLLTTGITFRNRATTMITQKNAKFVSFHFYVQTLKGASHFVNAWILFLNMYNVGRFEVTRTGTDLCYTPLKMLAICHLLYSNFLVKLTR